MKLPRSSDIFGVIAALETSDECRRFLGEVLSPDELRDVVTRWEILLLLVQGLTYQDISSQAVVNTLQYVLPCFGLALVTQVRTSPQPLLDSEPVTLANNQNTGTCSIHK
jgi:uncharacterized protein YerC